MSDHGPEEHDEAYEPSPTIYPLGFAVGIAVILVGLIVDPLLIGGIGVAITLVFGFLWIREATREYRAEHVKVEPETRDGAAGDARAGEGGRCRRLPAQPLPRDRRRSGSAP